MSPETEAIPAPLAPEMEPAKLAPLYQVRERVLFLGQVPVDAVVVLSRPGLPQPLYRLLLPDGMRVDRVPEVLISRNPPPPVPLEWVYLKSDGELAYRRTSTEFAQLVGVAWNDHTYQIRPQVLPARRLASLERTLKRRHPRSTLRVPAAHWPLPEP